jgi:hypothetical protein
MYSMKLYIFPKFILGNMCLEALEPKKLKKRYICSDHFNTFTAQDFFDNLRTNPNLI